MSIEEQRKLMNQLKQMAINEAVTGSGKESISRNVGAQIDKIIDLAIVVQNQEGVNGFLSEKVDELQRKYNSMYNAFTVADDVRKELHRCYIDVRERENELQKRIDKAIEMMEINKPLQMDYQQALVALSVLKGEVNEY